MAILFFLVYTGICYWLIFLDGVEAIEDWKKFFLFGGFVASLTPQELKFYVGISWIASLVFLLISLFGAD